ncbi:MAG: 23S rRNA (adenine(2503)-C(2))-methyltransferase RlmN [Bacillota bacterium]
MDISRLSSILQGEARYRFKQAYTALYRDLISSWSEVSVLPIALRERLDEECPLLIESSLSGGKKTQKALITFSDGAAVETVLIRHRDGRNTVCLSSQAGCPLNCAFCATGANGFLRNLSSGEIVEQFFFWARHLKTEGGKIDNVVFMGMGEPFLNYDQFIKAAKDLNDPEKFSFASRRLSVSTAGIIEGIRKLSREKMQMNLAISLHAANDSLRQQLMPIAQRYPLDSLMRAVDEYIRLTSRRVMFEYLMLKNINDSEDDAQELALLMKKPLHLVNLIPYNPTGRFQPSSPQRIKAFKEKLESAGIAVTSRHSLGNEIEGACGQLAGKKRSK